MTHSDGPFLRSHDKGSRFLEASRDVCHVEITPTACGPSLSEGSKAENWILWPDRLPLRVPASWRAMTCRSVAVRGLWGGPSFHNSAPRIAELSWICRCRGMCPYRFFFAWQKKSGGVFSCNIWSEITDTYPRICLYFFIYIFRCIESCNIVSQCILLISTACPGLCFFVSKTWVHFRSEHKS